MITWSSLLFGFIQLVILAVHYYLSFGHHMQIQQHASRIDSLQGKVSNANRAARREAQKVLEEQQPPAQQQGGGGNEMMQELLPALLMGQMGGGQNQPQQQGGQGDGEANDLGPVLGSGGSDTPASRQ